MRGDLLGALVAAGGDRILAGLAAAVVSAVLYDLGYVLEKQALSHQPELRPTLAGVARVACRSGRWRAGFTAMLAGLGLQFVALTLAPVAVVQPVLAAGLVALVALGGRLLGERLGRAEQAALGLAVAGVASVAISSAPGATVAGSVGLGTFAALALPLAALAGLLGWARLPPAARVPRGRPRRWPGSLAGSAGVFYGLGAICEKAVATRLVGQGLMRGALATLASPYLWLFFPLTLAGLVLFQVALQRHPASTVATVANAISSVLALVGASVVFKEELLPAGWWALVRLAGFAGIAAAMVTGSVLRRSSPLAGAEVEAVLPG